MRSLYHRLGGEPILEKIVDLLYAKVMADAELNPFFTGLNITRQRRKFRAFVSTVTGGPQQRSAIELRAAHAETVSKGLSLDHFTAFLERFKEALQELKVPSGLSAELMAAVAKTRDDVLGL